MDKGIIPPTIEPSAWGLIEIATNFPRSLSSEYEIAMYLIVKKIKLANAY